MDTITTIPSLLTSDGSAQPVMVGLMPSEKHLIAAAPGMYFALNFAATALSLIDLTCADAPPSGKRCEECGPCAGYAALLWAQKELAKARGEA